MIKIEKGLWNRLEFFPWPETVMADWASHLGNELGFARSFLRPTGAKAEWYPCTQKPGCGCEHEVFEWDNGLIRAVCRCDEPDCDVILLKPEDLIIYELDMRQVCEAIRNAFGFGPPNDSAAPEKYPHHWAVGTCGAFKSAVYLAMRLTQQEFISEIEKIMNEHPEPFVLLGATCRQYSTQVHSMLHRNKCEFIDLSQALAFDGPGKFIVKESVDAILGRFDERLSHGPQAAKLLAEMKRDIEKLQPPAPEPVQENVAQQVFSVLMKLKGKRAAMKAPLHDVFVLLVLKNLSQKQAAVECGCSEGLMSARSAELEVEFGRSLEQLRALASPILELQRSVRGDQRKKKSAGAVETEETEEIKEEYRYEGKIEP